MQSRLTLVLIDDRERSRPVSVTSARFTIGSAPDNDLVLGEAGLERRHALIEWFDGTVQISQCGSAGKITVNGRPLTAAAILSNRDLISLGGVCDIEVRLDPGPSREGGVSETSAVNTAPKSSSGDPQDSRFPAHSPLTIGIDWGVIASLTAVLIFVTLVLYLVIGRHRSPVSNPTPLDSAVSERPMSAPIPSTNPEAESTKAADDSVGQIGKLAMDVMRRISREDKQYDFSEDVLREIKVRVQRHRSSPALEAGLSALGQQGSGLAKEVQQERAMEPSLVFYAALTEMVGAQTRLDPISISRSVLQDLREIRKDYGTDTSDSCLMVIAVHKMKSRALPTSAVRDAFRDRSVWYLHDHGKIDDAAYEFVLSFLAVGVIAQNPRQFGLEAHRLPF